MAMTECRQATFQFQGIKGKRVEGKFDGGMVTTEAGALVGTMLASAEMQTIRLRLIKIAATVTVTARRVFFSMASGFPLKELFTRSLKNVTA